MRDGEAEVPGKQKWLRLMFLLRHREGQNWSPRLHIAVAKPQNGFLPDHLGYIFSSVDCLDKGQHV